LANERANLAAKIEQKKKLQEKLATIPESNTEEVQDLKNRLDTIIEEGDEDRLHQIEIKMKDIQSRQDLNKIHDENLTQYQDLAAEQLEVELQDMKKNYLVGQENRDPLFDLVGQTNADDCVSSSDDEGNQDKKGYTEDKPIYGLANEDVPEDLRQWIATPEKFQAYKEQMEDTEQKLVPDQFNQWIDDLKSPVWKLYWCKQHHWI